MQACPLVVGCAALVACGGTRSGAASIDISDINPPVASSGTRFDAENNPFSAAPMGRFDILLSLAPVGSSCEDLGHIQEDGLLGTIELWSPSTSVDLAPGSYPLFVDAAQSNDGGAVTAQFLLVNQTSQVQYVAQSGVVTISSAAGGHLVGTLDATTTHNVLEGTQNVEDTVRVTGRFDAPLCSKSSAIH